MRILRLADRCRPDPATSRRRRLPGLPGYNPLLKKSPALASGAVPGSD
jgi:hypothetical protein